MIRVSYLGFCGYWLAVNPQNGKLVIVDQNDTIKGHANYGCLDNV